jgi:hypothetical protein
MGKDEIMPKSQQQACDDGGGDVEIVEIGSAPEEIAVTKAAPANDKLTARNLMLICLMLLLSVSPSLPHRKFFPVSRKFFPSENFFASRVTVGNPKNPAVGYVRRDVHRSRVANDQPQMACGF